MTDLQTVVTPRIYVACLASYNSGQLFGRWIEVGTDADEIEEAVQKILLDSPQPQAEEWAIHDHEGFEGIAISESESFEDVVELACALEEGGEAFALFYDNQTFNSIDDAVEQFDEKYLGEHDSEKAYAEQYVDDCVDLSAWGENARYFDYEAFGRDLFLDGHTALRGSGNVHVFSD